ncbi:MAG: helix-turn-helix transcriptional regulator [bacterium]
MDTAKSGLWTINSFIKLKSGYVSPVFIKAVEVLNPDCIKFLQNNNRKGEIAVFITIMFLLVLIIAIFIIRALFFKKAPRELTRQGEIINDAIKYIENNFRNYNLNRAGVASKLNISEGYLGQLFRKEKRINFTDFLNQFRINKSKELLKTGTMKITDIALEVGYRSLDNYLAAFKKFERITPTQYRQNC